MCCFANRKWDSRIFVIYADENKAGLKVNATAAAVAATVAVAQDI